MFMMLITPRSVDSLFREKQHGSKKGLKFFFGINSATLLKSRGTSKNGRVTSKKCRVFSKKGIADEACKF
jgi:hypothetical protein